MIRPYHSAWSTKKVPANSLTERVVKYHSLEWSKLVFEGWITSWVYRVSGMCIMRKD